MCLFLSLYLSLSLSLCLSLSLSLSLSPSLAHAQPLCIPLQDGWRALDILEEMTDFGIPVEVRACNSTLQACLACGLVEDAEKLSAPPPAPDPSPTAPR